MSLGGGWTLPGLPPTAWALALQRQRRSLQGAFLRGQRVRANTR